MAQSPVVRAATVIRRGSRDRQTVIWRVVGFGSVQGRHLSRHEVGLLLRGKARGRTPVPRAPGHAAAERGRSLRRDEEAARLRGCVCWRGGGLPAARTGGRSQREDEERERDREDVHPHTSASYVIRVVVLRVAGTVATQGPLQASDRRGGENITSTRCDTVDVAFSILVPCLS